MKLSARNILRGPIVEVHKGQTTAHVVLDREFQSDLGDHQRSVDDLKLRKGHAAYAVIKASDVMVAID
jgi:molybdopterin-binding protein